MPIRRNQLSAMVLNIDGTNVVYAPNTLTFKRGDFAQRNVSNLTAGGNTRVTLISRDVSTMTDEVKFELEVSTESRNQIADWQAASDVAGCDITISEGDAVEAFSGMVITDIPEFAAQNDGKVSIVFQA